MSQVVQSEREHALILQQTDRMPQAAVGYLRLLLQYLYGLEVSSTDRPMEAAGIAMKHGPSLKLVIVIQEEAARRTALLGLCRQGEVPLLLVMPPDLAASHQALSQGMPNLTVCDWTHALGPSDSSMQACVDGALEAHGIVKLPVEGADHVLLHRRVTERVSHLSTLPTLPDLLLRLARMLGDPKTVAQDVEQVIISDPAVVGRLLQVVNSSAYAGTRGDDSWTLRDAIVRLGLKQVAGIAQQIKLINSLVRPQDSAFDLRRFWEHCVGTACIADRLYREKLLPLQKPIPFDLYWVAALLHDIGKLVLGFLAWDYCAEVLQQMRDRGDSFHRAEERLGHEVTHEYLGRLLMLHSGASEALTEVVGDHNAPGRRPSELVCLVHMADSICCDLGLGYLAEESGSFNSSVLLTLGMSRKDAKGLREALGDVHTEIRELVAYCLAD